MRKNKEIYVEWETDGEIDFTFCQSEDEVHEVTFSPARHITRILEVDIPSVRGAIKI